MASNIPDENFLTQTAVSLYTKTYGYEPTVGVIAPARVNLIGEHTDYNDGFVLPMALPLVTMIVGSKTDSGNCSIVTNSLVADEPRKISFNLPKPDRSDLTPGQPAWGNYIKGVLANFLGKLCSFNAAIVSSVPLGGGLASSASIEVAMYTFLEALTGKAAPSLKAKALACRKAEHDFPKMPCGIMDQFISVMGIKNNALLIDCRSMEATPVPLNDPSVIILITNSNVRHELTGSEYPARTSMCKEAAKLIDKPSLRDVSPKELVELEKKLEKIMFKRVRHVVTEIQRTEEAAAALKQNDYKIFGKLMVESHNSLRDDYEVSCPELDSLVSLALQIDGVFGSRMTGGGFGGCTVTLVQKSVVKDVIDHVKKNYTGDATFYVCTPSSGARIVFHK